MAASATLSDDNKPGTQSASRSIGKPAPQPPKQAVSSVYAAYWQERSGFFSAESELPQRPSTR
jgi:hypothetical protein